MNGSVGVFHRDTVFQKRGEEGITKLGLEVEIGEELTQLFTLGQPSVVG